MHITIATLFPGLLDSALAPAVGLLGKAISKQLLTVDYLDLKAIPGGGHHQLDDAPYGGGAGLLMRADVGKAIATEARAKHPNTRVVLLTPDGVPFQQSTARRLCSVPHVTFVCPRYEGIDERARAFFDEELSLGDFILSGGEYAVLPVIDAVARLQPGMLGNQTSTVDESYSHPGRLEAAQYTRPESFEGRVVPKVLLSGHHQNIARYRLASSALRTIERRIDLVAKYPLSREEEAALTWLTAQSNT